jgi:hypothetical protein
MPALGERFGPQPLCLALHAVEQLPTDALKRTGVQTEVLGEIAPVNYRDRGWVQLVTDAQR